jgi:hypothetical protein
MADPADIDRPASDGDDVSARPIRSLWDVMRHESGSASEAAQNDAASQEPDDSTSRGLEGLANAVGAGGRGGLLSDEAAGDIEFAEASPATEFDPEAGIVEETESETLASAGEVAGEDSDGASLDASSDDGLGSRIAETRDVIPDLSLPLSVGQSAVHRGGGTRKPRDVAVMALVLGIAAAGLSLLSLLPQTALRVFPAIAGLAALVNGWLALAKRRAGSFDRQVLFAATGLSLGLVGLFAGPLWLNEAGDRWRHEQASRIVTDNLQQIGAALDVFHGEHQRFPAGGSFVDSVDGFPIGMHGWITDLLPYLGYEELSSQIDRRRAWSDPVNGPAMQTRIELLLTPGTPYGLTATGHAPTHFAGVGGRNMQVTRDDVIDGLSQTMVAGEIAQSIPAWGEPDNWRSMGAGLNQSPQGFGNATDTGAHFLMADGSVRFLPNRTSLRTLQRWSTRNGSER